MGNAQAALVGDVLAQAEGAVGHNRRLAVLGGQHLDRVELLYEDVGLGLERSSVLLRPPVVHVAVLVEVAALVVEPVGHLVADHHADGTVVHGVVSLGVVERRLEDGCREADLVGRRVVVGVHRLGRHVPLVLIDRLAELRNIVGRIPEAGIHDVLEIALRGVDRQRRIVLPLVRVTDLHREGRQFFLSLGLRGVRHPVQRRDMLPERRLQVLHQPEHTLFVLCGEIFGDIHLAHGLGKDAVGHRHGSLPAGFHLLLAGHRLAVEIERCLLEIVAQVRRGIVQVLRREVVTDILQRSVLHQVVGVGDRRFRRHDDRVEVADAHGFIVSGPVYGIVGLLELGLRRGVVLRRYVAQLGVRPRLLGQFRLDVHHTGHGFFDVSLGDACKTEELAQILLVGRPDILVLGVEVVIAVAHREARLRDIKGIDIAVHQVSLHTHGKEGVGDRRVESGNGTGQLCTVADSEDLPDGVLHRSCALGVQAYRIEPHLIEVGDLLLDAAGLGLHLGHLREKLVDTLLVVITQDIERTVARIFRFEGVVLLPAARGVLVEVGIRGYRKVEVGQVDGGGFGGILTTCHTSYCCSEKNDFFHCVRVFSDDRGVRPCRNTPCLYFGSGSECRLICGSPPHPEAPCLPCIRAGRRRRSKHTKPCPPGRTC